MKPIDYELLKTVMPHSSQDLHRFTSPLSNAMEEFEINTPARAAAFLAQLAHESGSFRYMEELASGEAYDNRASLGNLDPEAIRAAAAHGTTPGPFYKGHGPIQITGYFNHRQCGEALGLDLVNNPTLITDPENGCRAAAWFWKSRGLNELADRGLFEAITRRINGGLTHLAERKEFWYRAIEAIKEF